MRIIDKKIAKNYKFDIIEIYIVLTGDIVIVFYVRLFYKKIYSKYQGQIVRRREQGGSESGKRN